MGAIMELVIAELIQRASSQHIREEAQDIRKLILLGENRFPVQANQALLIMAYHTRWDL